MALDEDEPGQKMRCGSYWQRGSAEWTPGLGLEHPDPPGATALTGLADAVAIA